MSRIEYLEGLLSGTTRFPPAGEMLGVSLLGFDEGQATLGFKPRADFMNFAGTVQGGILTAFADSAMGAALATVCADDESWATLELKVNFMRPAREHGEQITCHAHVSHKGRTIAFMEAEVFDSSSRMVAKVTASFAIRPG